MLISNCFKQTKKKPPKSGQKPDLKEDSKQKIIDPFSASKQKKKSDQNCTKDSKTSFKNDKDKTQIQKQKRNSDCAEQEPVKNKKAKKEQDEKKKKQKGKNDEADSKWKW